MEVIAWKIYYLGYTCKSFCHSKLLQVKVAGMGMGSSLCLVSGVAERGFVKSGNCPALTLAASSEGVKD
ncbi:unnamed protein product [Arctogadus glacialis]